MKTLIDTSFVVALVNSRDEDHEKASRLSIEFDGAPTVVTDAVLLEIGNSLSRNFKTDAIRLIEGFFVSPEVEVVRLSERLFEAAFAFYRSQPDKTYGLVDCISFVVMRDRGIHDALTHDRHFVQAGFNALMLSFDS